MTTHVWTDCQPAMGFNGNQQTIPSVQAPADRRNVRVCLDGLVCCLRCKFIHEAARHHFCKSHKRTRSLHAR